MHGTRALALALVVGTSTVAAISSAEELTKTDRQGPVAVTVSLLTAPRVGSPVKVKVGLDTHSVGLDGIAFQTVVVWRGLDGIEVPPTLEQAKGSEHHREAVLVFPSVSQAGTGRILVKDVGGVPERVFTWEWR